MIEYWQQPEVSRTYLLIRPARSLSWKGNLYLLGLLAIPQVIIATGFAIQGLWLVLPFAGLELLVLTVAIYFSARRLDERELLTVEKERLLYQRGRREVAESIQFQRAWVQLQLSGGDSEWNPLRIHLRCCGKRAELGRDLGAGEQRELLAHLQDLNLRPKSVAGKSG